MKSKNVVTRIVSNCVSAKLTAAPARADLYEKVKAFFEKLGYQVIAPMKSKGEGVIMAPTKKHRYMGDRGQALKEALEKATKDTFSFTRSKASGFFDLMECSYEDDNEEEFIVFISATMFGITIEKQ